MTGARKPSPLTIMTKPGPEPDSPATTTLTNPTLCHSIKSDVSLVKDPEFWRRFAAAIHQDEEQARQPEHEKKDSESWLVRQRKKARRTKICGFVIAFAIVLLACGVGVAIWILSKNDWFQREGTVTQQLEKNGRY